MATYAYAYIGLNDYDCQVIIKGIDPGGYDKARNIDVKRFSYTEVSELNLPNSFVSLGTLHLDASDSEVIEDVIEKCITQAFKNYQKHQELVKTSEMISATAEVEEFIKEEVKEKLVVIDSKSKPKFRLKRA